jgi:hypothetical protein
MDRGWAATLVATGVGLVMLAVICLSLLHMSSTHPVVTFGTSSATPAPSSSNSPPAAALGG